MMPIKVLGLKRVRRKLGVERYRQAMRPAMAKSLAVVESDLKEYPPPRPGQRYIRGRGPTNAAGVVIRNTSENLGKRWTVRIKSVPGGLQGRVGNNTSYGPFVQSDNFQAWMHTGRWTTDKEAIDDNADKIAGFFQQEIRKILGE